MVAYFKVGKLKLSIRKLFISVLQEKIFAATPSLRFFKLLFYLVRFFLIRIFLIKVTAPPFPHYTNQTYLLHVNLKKQEL